MMSDEGLQITEIGLIWRSEILSVDDARRRITYSALEAARVRAPWLD
jgi:hypothetical protein